MLELLTLLFLFDAKQPALAQWAPPQSGVRFEAPASPAGGPADASGGGFTLAFTVDLKKFDARSEILQIPGVLSIRLRQHNPGDRGRQNYPTFKMPDGSLPVLEATVALHSAEHPDWKEMCVGIPLAMLSEPQGPHEVVLNFTGARWTMYVDGELMDNDFPFGYPRWPTPATLSADPTYVRRAALYCPALVPRVVKAPAPRLAPVQYWTPPGHNSWVGDVATCFYRGRYHLFYLYDRRHHQSKFGRGAHYFEHLSTADFKTWTEHEAATPLEEQWECIGTGTPFVFRDKLCLSYGLHTTRIFPQEKTALPAQWEHLKKNGRTNAFRRESTAGVPAGATYAVSQDGLAKFKKSWVLFHPCENPSVYTAPGGELRMMANYRSNGIWESESIDGGWRCIHPGFPPGGDCTFFFRWGRFDYVIGGFTGLWSKPADAPNSAYASVVAKGLDFYDGLNVPAVTEVAGGRVLMAGWIPIHGWGGNLVIRELIQYPDGRIGSKWMKEITPETAAPQALATKTAETTTIATKDKSFVLSFDVHPAQAGKGRFAVTFLGEEGEQASCELQVRLDERRAQFGPGSLLKFAERQKSLREGGAPHRVGHYAIENLIGADGPFAVRVMVKGDDKIGGSLVDAEIAGQRTMITYRPGLTVRKMLFRLEGVELKDLQVAREVSRTR